MSLEMILFFIVAPLIILVGNLVLAPRFQKHIPMRVHLLSAQQDSSYTQCLLQSFIIFSYKVKFNVKRRCHTHLSGWYLRFSFGLWHVAFVAKEMAIMWAA